MLKLQPPEKGHSLLSQQGHSNDTLTLIFLFLVYNTFFINTFVFFLYKFIFLPMLFCLYFLFVFPDFLFMLFCHYQAQIQTVLAWVLIPLENHNPAISSLPQTLKILTSPPRQTKSPDNSNTLNMFNNNTFTNFKTAYKLMLIPPWCHA